MAPLPFSRCHLHLKWERFIAVTTAYELVWPPLHRVGCHQFRSVIRVIRQLQKLGYRRIGMVLERGWDERNDHLWIGGFSVAQRRFSVTDQVPIFIERSLVEEKIAAWYLKWKPDVILAFRSRMIFKTFEKSNLRIPQDVGFVHLELPERNEEMAGIYQNWPSIGAAAIDILSNCLQRNEVGIPLMPYTLLIDGEWVAGKTILNLKESR